MLIKGPKTLKIKQLMAPAVPMWGRFEKEANNWAFSPVVTLALFVNEEGDDDIVAFAAPPDSGEMWESMEDNANFDGYVTRLPEGAEVWDGC